jgi:hypothetical protein
LRTRSYFLFFAFAVWLIPLAGAAEEPNFVVTLESCKVVVGHLTLEDDTLKVTGGNLGAYTCNRESNKVLCVLTYIGKRGAEEEKIVEFDVEMDSPPILILKTDAYADFMMIDTTEGSAVTITRIVRQRIAVAKVCQGLFATSSDPKGLRDDK